ncbi:maternal effect embryo arrest [Thalictrum thalictroides]|uniref:Maternal effect embryo arrest n=1 Tax=Thalictrum thalictroides TaxID=46969 RepID=A0A7J6WEI3_THATH|nr:maternal effect embryo arrest [Thalictrum thalictroides]
MDMETSHKFGTSIYLTALDGAVNVNSLFMLAVFIGLAWDPFDPNYSLINDDRCFPGAKVAEDLICFHVYSFASFLFSSLIALSLKQGLKISRNSNNSHHRGDNMRIMKARINKTFLRIGILAISAGSVFGCGFLVLAMINVVRLKLGTLSCPSSNYSIAALVPLLIFVPGALLIYVCLVLYAFTR